MISTAAALLAAIRAAKVGAIVALGAGNYGAVTVANLTFAAPGVTIDASAPGVVFATLDLDNDTGITVKSPTLQNSPGIAMAINNGASITVSKPHCVSPVLTCVTISRSHDITIDTPFVENSGGDGVDIGGSQRVTILNPVCMGNAPLNGIHPDCVQLYSISATATAPCDHNSYIAVVNGVAIGNTQGFDDWDHDAACGADHVTMTGNVVAAPGYNCIGLYNATASTVTGNRCVTLPGAIWPTRVNILGGSGNVISGNIDGATP